MTALSPPAIILYIAIASGIGVGSYLMYSAGNERKDWLVVGTGLLLGIITAGLGYTEILGWQAEKMLGYLPAIPIPFAIAFLYLTRDYYGGEVSRYFEVMSIGLGMNFLLYIPHLFWHFQGQKLGGLPNWGLNPSFWYVFFHGLSAVGFIIISYSFYLLYQSTEK